MTSERVPYTQSRPDDGDRHAARRGHVACSINLDIDEAINALFEIRADVKSQRDDLRAGDLIGATVDYSLKLKDGGTRWWNGFVTALHEGPLTNRGTRGYAMTVRPKLWLMTQKSGLPDPSSIKLLPRWSRRFAWSTALRTSSSASPASRSRRNTRSSGTRPISPTCCAACRRDGLFYWFEHKQGHHTFVVADHYSGYRASSPSEVRYTLGSAAQDQITDWRRTFAFTPGKRTGRDWNFLTMQTPTATQSTFAAVPGNAQKELYEFPGRFADTTGAEQMTKNRIQATETGFETVEGHFDGAHARARADLHAL